MPLPGRRMCQAEGIEIAKALRKECTWPEECHEGQREMSKRVEVRESPSGQVTWGNH